MKHRKIWFNKKEKEADNQHLAKGSLHTWNNYNFSFKEAHYFSSKRIRIRKIFPQQIFLSFQCLLLFPDGKSPLMRITTISHPSSTTNDILDFCFFILMVLAEFQCNMFFSFWFRLADFNIFCLFSSVLHVVYKGLKTNTQWPRFWYMGCIALEVHSMKKCRFAGKFSSQKGLNSIFRCQHIEPMHALQWAPYHYCIQLYII